LPKTIITLCMSSMPAHADATDENSSKFRRAYSITFAQRAAAYGVTSRGAQASMPWLSDLD
jgi:sugar/nucleoside kinase (ribokinase family)